MPKTNTYKELNQQLEAIMSWFESAEADVDEAIAKYEQAMRLIKEIEQYLKLADNKLKKLKIKLD